MKITTKCDGTPFDMQFGLITAGTIFRYGSYQEGPYLKTNNGMVNLKANAYHRPEDCPTKVPNYKELPNATLVTNE